APYQTAPVGPGRSVAVADVTGDGRNDVLMTTLDDPHGEAPDGHLWLFVQGSDGRYARTDSWPMQVGYFGEGSVAAGDIDGDGKTDAVVARGGGLAVFLQRAGGLVPGPTIPTPGAEQVQAADLDGDGRLDLVVNL